MTATTATAEAICEALGRRGSASVRARLTAYMKGSTPFYGCTTPQTRACVDAVAPKPTRKRARGETEDARAMTTRLDDAVALLRHTHGEAKQAGVILLCEREPLNALATVATLDRLERDVLRGKSVVGDWAVADALATKVLRKMWKHNPELAPKILSWAHDKGASLWHRRCGIVAFASFWKDQTFVDEDFGVSIVDACEINLLAAPSERFAQTGTAWVTRYALACDDDRVRQHAIDMVKRRGNLWNGEAKRSLVEQLTTTSSKALAREILSLGGA